MNVPSCVRRLQFAAGHRVHNHESKCANLHGHNYIVFIHARGTLDSIGRVIDFSVLKERFGNWIDRHWDHGFLYYNKDIELQRLFLREEVNSLKFFCCDFNPTAENMAQFLLTMAPFIMNGTEVQVHKVVLWETENCYAEVSLEE